MDVRRNFIVLQTTTTDVNFKSSILIDCDQKRSLCSLKNWSLLLSPKFIFEFDRIVLISWECANRLKIKNYKLSIMSKKCFL